MTPTYECPACGRVSKSKGADLDRCARPKCNGEPRQVSPADDADEKRKGQPEFVNIPYVVKKAKRGQSRKER